MHKYMKSALMSGLLMGGALTLSAQAPQSTQSPQSTTTPQSSQSKGGAAERSSTEGTMGRVKEYNAGQRLVIEVAGAPERSYDLSSKEQSIVVAPNLKAGDTVRIMENETGGRHTINITVDSGSSKGGGAADQNKR